MAQARKRPKAELRARPHGGKRPGSGRWGSGPARCSVCTHPDHARIDYLLASGASGRAVAAQFGLVQQTVSRHFAKHVSDRFKKMCSAAHLDGFEKLLTEATETNAETLDILNLLVRGHAQRWGVCLDAGDDKKMASHGAKILQAIELRSRITLELQPEARNLTVNNFLMKDAAELTNMLRAHPAAVAELDHWYTRRMKDVTPAEHVVEAAD